MIAITAQKFVCRLHMLKCTSLSLIYLLFTAHAEGEIATDFTKDELELVHLAAHDPDAFTELYHRYLPRVYRYHMARTGHIQEAEDLTAQTFLTAFESLSSYRGKGKFSSWLFGIASHKLADHYRRSRRELPLEEAEQMHSPLPLPEESASLSLDLARVAHLLKLISPERAEALVLCLFAGLSLAEAAHAVGKSEAAVKMLVHRGICDLQERLAVPLEVA
jgi:RNA polymerase sigma-70 factor (ECF subfamily)